MPGPGLRCAYCGEPLALIPRGVNAWRIGNQFVCNAPTELHPSLSRRQRNNCRHRSRYKIAKMTFSQR
jgi:hypothetical protein